MSDVRVMVVDDSPLVREILARELDARPGVRVVGRAGDGEAALEGVRTLRPDVITLDLEMPRMDGLAFLRRVMAERPLPVVVVSGRTRRGQRTALTCLEAGAIGVLTKPRGKGDLPSFCDELARILREAGAVRLGAATVPPAAPATTPRAPAASVAAGRAGGGTGAPTTASIVAIGASTGGTEAIAAVLAGLGPASPPVVIVQHMPPGFTRTFAERLDERTPLLVREADGEHALQPGTALVAPGDRHLVVRRRAGGLRAEVTDGPHVRRHRPSVEALYDSVLEALGAGAAADAVAVLLTGMGDDGAEALGRLRTAGARTICQDEATSVVWGMPGAAVRAGHAGAVLPLDAIGRELAKLRAERTLRRAS